MTRELRYLLARLVTCFFAVLAVAAFVPDGIVFPPEGTRDFWTTITAFAAVLALVNAYVRPVVDLLLKPVTCVLGMLTLGLSHVVVSAARLLAGGSDRRGHRNPHRDRRGGRIDHRWPDQRGRIGRARGP